MSSNPDIELDNTSISDLLGDLEPSIRRYPYKGTTQMLQDIETEEDRQNKESDPSEWMLFTDVDKQAFNQIRNSEDRILQRYWHSYDSLQNLLLIGVV